MITMGMIKMIRIRMTMKIISDLPILPLDEESLSFLLFPDNETPLFLSSSS